MRTCNDCTELVFLSDWCIIKEGWKAAQSFLNLNEFFDESTISGRQCREWCSRFKTGFGYRLIQDNSGKGRPSDFNDQALLTVVQEDESTTTRMLSQDFNVQQSMIVRRFTSSPTTRQRVRIFTNFAVTKQTNTVSQKILSLRGLRFTRCFS